jgi:hypothetical protein
MICIEKRSSFFDKIIQDSESLNFNFEFSDEKNIIALLLAASGLVSSCKEDFWTDLRKMGRLWIPITLQRHK